MITNDTVTRDDTLSAELDALGAMYWRWAVRDDALAHITNDLHAALRAVVIRLAPEGTDGEALASWVFEAFSDNGGERKLTDCMALALTPMWRGRWDVSYITCDYGPAGEVATRITDSDEALCDKHAKEHFGTDWRAETRKLGVRAIAARNA